MKPQEAVGREKGIPFHHRTQFPAVESFPEPVFRNRERACGLVQSISFPSYLLLLSLFRNDKEPGSCRKPARAASGLGPPADGVPRNSTPEHAQDAVASNSTSESTERQKRRRKCNGGNKRKCRALVSRFGTVSFEFLVPQGMRVLIRVRKNKTKRRQEQARGAGKLNETNLVVSFGTYLCG